LGEQGEEGAAAEWQLQQCRLLEEVEEATPGNHRIAKANGSLQGRSGRDW